MQSRQHESQKEAGDKSCLLSYISFYNLLYTFFYLFFNLFYNLK